MNYGTYMMNPISGEIVTARDVNGNSVTNAYQFGNYRIDDNQCVMRFIKTPENGVQARFSFEYKCDDQ